MKKWQSSVPKVLFHILWLFSGFTWSEEWQYYSICTAQNTPQWAIEWADSVGLELELSKGVLLKNCSISIENKEEQIDVLICLNGNKEIGFANTVQITIYLDGVKLEDKKYTKEQLLSLDAEKYAHKFKQKVVELQSQLSKQNLLESLVNTSVLQTPDMHANPEMKSPKWFINSNLGVESWHYDLRTEGKFVTSNAVEVRTYPYLLLNVEWWPLAWLSLITKANFSLFGLQMKIEDDQKFYNELILGKQYYLETGFKLRYVFDSGFGLSFNAGYWMQIGSVDNQKYEDKIYTQLPSFAAHALILGGEIYYKSPVSGVETTFGVDALPLVYYQEKPDSPGTNAMTFGAQASFNLRYFFDGFWFVEGKIGAVALFVKYDGEGTRLTTDEQLMQGGFLYSYKFNGGIGLGVTL